MSDAVCAADITASCQKDIRFNCNKPDAARPELRDKWRLALGLSLLWVVGYALPLMGEAAIYFRPRTAAILFIPSIVALAALVPLQLLLMTLLSRIARILWASMIAASTVIAVMSLFAAADFPWPSALEAIFGTDGTGLKKQIARVAVILMALGTVIFSIRMRWLGQHAKLLASLGFALFALVCYRWISQELWDNHPARPHTARSATNSPALTTGGGTRRVVWVIFDEMDERVALEEAAKAPGIAMPNFEWLRTHALSAAQANSPTSDTLTSLPALLSGRPVTGFQMSGPAELMLSASDRTEPFLFSEADSVFNDIPGGPRTGSLTGFYHPYCQIFQSLHHCDARFLAFAGEPTDALTFILPKFLHRSFDEHYRITDGLLTELDVRLIDPNEQLTFVHLNMPHLPSSYAQKALHMPRVLDADGMYRQNLRAADVVLGRILSTLRLIQGQDTLLIVSTDHWWRMLSPKQPRPVPFYIWHVGEQTPVRIEHPLSTVHTSKLVTQFLRGEVSGDQHALARWWQEQPFIPTWIQSAGNAVKDAHD